MLSGVLESIKVGSNAVLNVGITTSNTILTFLGGGGVILSDAAKWWWCTKSDSAPTLPTHQKGRHLKSPGPQLGQPISPPRNDIYKRQEERCEQCIKEGFDRDRCSASFRQWQEEYYRKCMEKGLGRDHCSYESNFHPPAFYPKGTILRTSIEIEQWLPYEPSAMDCLLDLRLPTTKKLPANTKPFATPQELLSSPGFIFVSSCKENIVWPALIKEGSFTHWIGLIGQSHTGAIKVIDSDSSDFVKELALSESAIILPVVRQSANTCAALAIEYTFEYFTGTRTQEFTAPYVHSLLLENALIDSYQQVSKNQRLIGLLTGTTPLSIEHMVNTNNQISWSLIEVTHPHHTLPGSNFIHTLIANSWLKYKLLKYIYSAELAQIKPDLITLRALGMSDNPFVWIDSDFRKAVRTLKPHTDQGGSSEAFDAIWKFKSFTEDTNQIYTRALSKFTDQLQPKLYEATMGFKALDTAFAVADLWTVPTLENAKALAVNSLHFYSMTSGVNIVSGIAVTLSAGHTYYENGFFPALYEASTSAAYMILPGMLVAAISPHLVLPYTAFMTGLAGYHALSHAYSFYTQPTSELKSYEAWKAAADLCAGKIGLEICVSASEKYAGEIHSIKADLEKQAVQDQLQKEHDTELGNKLYRYIHEPFLETKRELQIYVDLGELKQEEADVILKEQLVAIPSKGYDMCRKGADSSEYYCSHKEDQSIHYVTIQGEMTKVEILFVGSHE